MKTTIHVNRQIIDRNRKNKERNPVITVKDYKNNRYTECAEIVDKDGNVVARVVHSPDKPLSCGARVWIETELEVRT
jgi:hypothetical protein